MLRSTLRGIFKITAPVFFGYIALGMGAGLLMAQKGYPVYITILESLFFYAGTGQYLNAGLFAAGAPLQMILFTQAIVNLRHVVYGLSLIKKFNGAKTKLPYLIFSLTDETFAILSSLDLQENPERTKIYTAISALDQLYWFIGTVLGHLLGSALNSKGISLEGVDFALTALFAVLLTEQLSKSKEFFPCICAALCTTITIILWRTGILSSSNDILFISLLASLVVISLITGLKKQKDFSNGTN